MSIYQDTKRFLFEPPADFLQMPATSLMPILARPGTPSVDLQKLKLILGDVANINPMVTVQSATHWEKIITNLDDSVDAILPLSNPAYPTEFWNSDPKPLVERGLPILFWSLMEHDEPDFWRFAAHDLLRTLGAEVYIVHNNAEGASLVKALAMRRFLRTSRLVVFGDQNFPWNAHAVGDRVTRSLGLKIIVRSIEDFRALYQHISDAEVAQYWTTRKNQRYNDQDVSFEDRVQAVRTALAIRTILQEEQAIGFGVNCFGDLIIHGGRDVPCLAQLLLREEGFIAACDGDFIAMTGMALGSFFLDKPCMTSNLYPIRYAGALTSHFGDPLSPGSTYPHEKWQNLGRLAHCGYVGIISPEMTSKGFVRLSDWGGTYEIKRDGRGCGVDGDLVAGERITVFSLTFDAKRLMVTGGHVAETTHHAGMPHCESSALLEIEHLPEFFEDVSRDHVIVIYDDHKHDFEILSQVLGLQYSSY
jgi:hypothetical protein